MVDFINEVEEELRKDKYNVLLRKYGPYIVAAIFAIIAFAGYVEYQKKSKSIIARGASTSFEASKKLEASGDLQAASDKYIALSEVAPNGYAGLSLVHDAGMKVQLGDMDAAISLFDQAADKFEKPRHRDLQTYKAALILAETGKYDDAQARLSTLIQDKSPYQDLARELEAQILYAKGDLSTARSKLSYLVTAPGVSSGVKSRSEQLLSLIVAVAPEPVPEGAMPEMEIPAPQPASPDETTAPESVTPNEEQE